MNFTKPAPKKKFKKAPETVTSAASMQSLVSDPLSSRSPSELEAAEALLMMRYQDVPNYVPEYRTPRRNIPAAAGSARALAAMQAQEEQDRIQQQLEQKRTEQMIQRQVIEFQQQLLAEQEREREQLLQQQHLQQQQQYQEQLQQQQQLQEQLQQQHQLQEQFELLQPMQQLQQQQLAKQHQFKVPLKLPLQQQVPKLYIRQAKPQSQPLKHQIFHPQQQQVYLHAPLVGNQTNTIYVTPMQQPKQTAGGSAQTQKLPTKIISNAHTKRPSNIVLNVKGKMLRITKQPNDPR